VWFPLHARCAPHTSPLHSSKPRSPVKSIGGDSCEVRPRRFSASKEPLDQSLRNGWNSRDQRPSKLSNSLACSATGSVTVSPSTLYRRSPVLVSVAQTCNTSSSRKVTFNPSSATASIASTERRLLSLDRWCDTAENCGAQARPPPRRPIRPGRPVNPKACSGTVDTGATESTVPWTMGRDSDKRTEARSTSAPSDAPQCTIVGAPVVTSTNTSVPPLDKRIISGTGPHPKEGRQTNGARNTDRMFD